MTRGFLRVRGEGGAVLLARFHAFAAALLHVFVSQRTVEIPVLALLAAAGLDGFSCERAVEYIFILVIPAGG